MTALPPLETRRVLGVDAAVYSANRVCAHPECAEPVPDRGHHIFPRSQITNGKYFVQAWDADGKEMFPHPIPHVTGLCRNHHDAVEQHRAWIKYEEGQFVWYWRCDMVSDEWEHIGPLDPQPAGREKVNKPKRPRLKGDDRRKRRRISIAVPNDRENGGEVWDEILDLVKDKLVRLELYGENDAIPNYEALIAALYDWVTD